VHFELVRDLLDIEQRHHTQARRSGILSELEQAIRRGFYTDEADAVARARRRQAQLVSTEPGAAAGETD
jgi:DNA sulfur modification protein DndC